MSSRNQYLSAHERQRAVEIQRTLQAMRDAHITGVLRTEIESAALMRLQMAGFEPDYAALRRPDLSIPEEGENGPQVALVAARLGRTRLIDNLEINVPETA